MKPRFSLLAAAALSFSLCAPASAVTTLYKFCADSSDGSSAADNRLVSTNAGWVINDIGADAKLGDGTYTYAFRLKNTTSVVSPTYTDGYAITKVVVGARVTNTARIYHVAPSVGSEQMKAATVTDKREELEFAFDSHAGVTAVTITTPSGTGNSYLYDVTITTLKPLSMPANLLVSGTINANDFAVAWGGVQNAEGYSVKLVGPNDTVVSSNDVSSATTTASFTGLTSSTAYTVVVIALGDHATTDDSAPATLSVETAASAAAAPTLVVANTSWTAGVAGSSSVMATLEGDVACMVESVTMSDGSSATVANGTLSWTPPASNLASSVTATFHVTHGTDGWYIDQNLSVASTPAPSTPVISFDNVSRQSFDASWTATAGGPVVSYKVRAWTGRATPDDATGSANEDFAAYRAGGSIPGTWNASSSLSSTYASDVAPVKFDKNLDLVSPVYLGNLTSLSFIVKRNGSISGSTFAVYGSSGESGSVFSLIESFDASTFSNTDDGTTLTLTVPAGMHQFKFSYAKSSGNVGFGTFSVSGTDWPAADFLEGWGGAKVSVGTDTSRTFANPVAGTANYVEVTAIGPTGLATSAIRSVDIPHAPSVVISVK